MLAMQHWNGNQLCVVDTETTGLDPQRHEIWQICILPLDSNIRIRKDVIPFNVELKLDKPQNIDAFAFKMNREGIVKAQTRGFDREKAKDLFEDWVKKLGLPTTKFGNPKRIQPLGHNYAFDRAFIQAWLGVEMYEQHFDHRYRDTMQSAIYLNDRAGMHVQTVPFSKLDLQWIATTLKVPSERAHDALSDCATTAEVYRIMLNQGLLG